MASVCEACKRKELCLTYKDAKAFYADLENFGCMHFRLGKPTNADRIRSMSDEELAEFLEMIPHTGNPPTYTIDGFCIDDGLRTKRQWLD